MFTNSIQHSIHVLSPFLFRVADVFSVIFAAILAYWMRFNNISMADSDWFITLVGALLVFSATNYQSLYRSYRGQSSFKPMYRLVISWFIAGAFLLFIIVFTHNGETYSRLWLGKWWVFSLVLMVFTRLLIYLILAAIRSRGHDQRSVFIIGDIGSKTLVEYKLSLNSWSGFNIGYFFDVMTEDVCSVESAVEKSRCEEVWICLPLELGGKIQILMSQLQHCTKNVRYIPNTQDLKLLNHNVYEVAGLNVMTLSASPHIGLSRFVKRIEDLLLGMFLFLLSFPIMLIIAIAIKCTSKGPLLFKQKRHGINGKEIKVYKFRSMYVHDESNGKVTQAKKDDSRITPVGKFLRRTSLDELPQFYNVIQGRMSIVGPRPHALAHNREYKEKVEAYMSRHKVKPGITGWAQVNGFRGETDTLEKMKKRVEFDLYYIDNWSLWLDLNIVFKTIFVGFLNKNAY